MCALSKKYQTYINEYVNNYTPAVFKDLLHNAKSKEFKTLTFNDGYYIFKSYNAVNEILLYQLWCTNLNEKHLTNIEFSELKEVDELNQSLWLLDEK